MSQPPPMPPPGAFPPGNMPRPPFPSPGAAGRPPPPGGMPPPGFNFPPGGMPPPGFLPNGPAGFPPNTAGMPSLPPHTAGAPPLNIPPNKKILNTTPCRTVYVSNLNEKVKIDVLKNSLRTLFKQFGEVLDVVAHRNIRARGQAYIAYPDVESAEKAIKELQHFILYDKPMVVQFAHNKSDVHAKQDGDWDTHFESRKKRKEEVSKLPLPGAHKPTFKPGRLPPGAVPMNPTANIPDEYLPPNKILFLQNLPETITQEQLIELFHKFPGFKEVRTIPAKKSIAFVEYDNELQSAVAKAELHNHSFGPDQQMKVTFARK
ncbi:hypothetical protein BDF20DRAFT_853435 [Mycotypha africana]|uniref:uncharacterized protein n=1 Tax=Mycotypha africana TaxID=64632 RepID=UPI0023005D15|nr:uncharacterized protein BDF20DRAFT_853435 [Mycotypha africana]KAI8988034.1 hypothetical protein BDF20DRAFT_853435 [Mycotypha africana]